MVSREMARQFWVGEDLGDVGRSVKARDEGCEADAGGLEDAGAGVEGITEIDVIGGGTVGGVVEVWICVVIAGDGRGGLGVGSC